MDYLKPFCTQLIRFFESLQETFPEERDISMGLEGMKAAKSSNPKLMLDMFHEYIYIPANDMIMNKREEEIITLARKVMQTQFNELMPTLMIFDRHWPKLSENNRAVIWEYLRVLCILCEKAKGIKKA
jgi:hypothetical protein